MNKNILIALAVVLLVGGGLFIVNRDTTTPENGGGAVTEEQDGSTIGTISGGIKGLLAQGRAMQCTFESVAEGGTTTGKVYVSGNDMRGDFELMQPDNKIVTSNMIRKGDMSYVWSSEFEQGLKSVIPDVEIESGTTEQAAGQSDPFAELDQDVKFDCKPWIVNNAMFTPPSDIEFVDLAAQMQQFQGEGDGANQIQCSACDQAPDAATRDQCRNALGCN